MIFELLGRRDFFGKERWGRGTARMMIPDALRAVGTLHLFLLLR